MNKYKNIYSVRRFNEIRQEERDDYLAKCKANNTKPLKHYLDLIDFCSYKTGYVYYPAGALIYYWKYDKRATALNNFYN